LKSALRCAFGKKWLIPKAKYTEKRIAMRLMTMTSQRIGQELRARRRFLRLRQRDLAELAGVTLRGLTDLENGRGNPTIKQLAKIAEVLGLDFTFVERSANAPS
jgi:DNA-binding XRE family transcriptional regulator